MTTYIKMIYVHFLCEYSFDILMCLMHCILCLLHPTSIYLSIPIEMEPNLWQTKIHCINWLIYKSFEWQMKHKYCTKWFECITYIPQQCWMTMALLMLVCMSFGILGCIFFLSIGAFYVTLTLEHLHSNWLVHCIWYTTICGTMWYVDL